MWYTTISKIGPKMGSKSGHLGGLRRGQNGVKNGVILGPSGTPPDGPKMGPFSALPGAENPRPETPENPALPVSNANICPDWESY